jgi:riboflavin biosynthesis pyrimidine reductase
MSRARFEAFAARKTAAATAAALPPYETERQAPRDGMLAIGNDWTRERFGGSFFLSPPRRGGPSCSLVFVQSADGNTGAARPSDLGGGLTDEILIYEGLSRVAADTVLSGAETVRGGGTVFSVWHPELVRLRESLGLPRHPVQMVATVQGLDIDRMLLFNVPELRAILVTVPDTAARLRDALKSRPWVTPVVMADRSDLPRAFEQLAALGIRRISCIGGRRLAASLVEAGLVDDLYLTTSPRHGGEPDTALPAAVLAGDVIVRKRGTREETGVVFEQLARR